MRPGVAERPRRSMTRAFFEASLRISSFVPRATIFPSRTAMACVTESCASTVMIFPLMRIRSEVADPAGALDCASIEIDQTRLTAQRVTVREKDLRTKVIVERSTLRVQLRLLRLLLLPPTCRRATDRTRRER